MNLGLFQQHAMGVVSTGCLAMHRGYFRALEGERDLWAHLQAYPNKVALQLNDAAKTLGFESPAEVLLRRPVELTPLKSGHRSGVD